MDNWKVPEYWKSDLHHDDSENLVIAQCSLKTIRELQWRCGNSGRKDHSRCSACVHITKFVETLQRNVWKMQTMRWALEWWLWRKCFMGISSIPYTKSARSNYLPPRLKRTGLQNLRNFSINQGCFDSSQTGRVSTRTCWTMHRTRGGWPIVSLKSQTSWRLTSLWGLRTTAVCKILWILSIHNYWPRYDIFFLF